MSAPVDPALARAASVPLWLLALITFAGTLAMHVFVPALPFAGQDLLASTSQMQQTVSLYIIGLAVGQLIYGPVSDRFGRRPVLMVGLALYSIAGLIAGLAPKVQVLIGARLLQALGGCAGLVLGRAIIRDSSAGTETTRRLALLNTIVTIGPGAAPIIGATLASTFGWRSIFALLCALGVVGLLCAWRVLPETRRDQETPMAATQVGRHYLQLLRTPAFVGFALGGGCATTSLYAFIATAPFVFVHQLNTPPHAVGLYMAVPILGVAVGSILATRLINRLPIRELMLGASALTAAAALFLLGAVLTHHLSVTLLTVTMFIYTIGVGSASPPALGMAMSVNRQAIGSASGLYGFTQMAIGALCTTLVGFGDDPAVSAAVVMSVAGLVAQASFWWAIRCQSRDALAAAPPSKRM